MPANTFPPQKNGCFLGCFVYLFINLFVCWLVCLLLLAYLFQNQDACHFNEHVCRDLQISNSQYCNRTSTLLFIISLDACNLYEFVFYFYLFVYGICICLLVGWVDM